MISFGSDGEIKVFDLVLLIDLLVLVVDLLDARSCNLSLC